MMLFSRIVLLIAQLAIVLGNTEKVIFLGPKQLQIPIAHPTLEDLHIDTLSPQQLSVRTHVHAEFPTEEFKHGPATWLLLNNLEHGRRYEVRICWAATVTIPPLAL